jgi:hypothetical protein
MSGVGIFMCCSSQVSKNLALACGTLVSCSGYPGSYISHILLMFTLFSCLPIQMLCFQFYGHNCLIGCEYDLLVIVKMVMIVIVIMKMTRMNLTPLLCHIC